MVKTNVQTQFGQNKRRKTDYNAKPHCKSLKEHKTTGNTLLKREHIVHGILTEDLVNVAFHQSPIGRHTVSDHTWRLDLRKHMIADLSSAKPTRHLSHPITPLYRVDHVSASIVAMRFDVTVAAGPKPPEAENTNGTKDAILISRTLCPYWRRLALSCRRYTEVI